ncbi:stress response translation initiation inhibitor YciH [Aliidiomarina indica]|uniref:stress response translation initiation inhibitor YciH n=1 Tax=Aliidiomarina indica TaxID=2749147 RepID=UPI00188F1186|nr:stress response translation initiation inhibitor YciH [Aliidiomarina indica]
MSLKDQLSTLVYSTDSGRVKETVQPEQAPVGDGIVRIKRETKGRKGKGVTTIHGVPGTEAELKTLAKALKQRCGVGGSVKDFVIEIQGDQRENCKSYLQQQGFTVKLAGG